ncbi:MAG: PspC domain-containing protein, partial [Candidatus Binatia bacterium]
MKKCPFCAEDIHDEAIRCRYCVSNLQASRWTGRRLYRSQRDRKLAGICRGLGEYFDIDPSW